MADELETLLIRLKDEKALFLGPEEATRQGAVLPILSRLGWDRDNIREVVPEFSVGNGRVDYCLRIDDRNSVFIEVKRTSEDLEPHQEQLLDYAFRDGVQIAVLTNGLLWWLYLPLFEGSWEQRKFLAIDIEQQDAVGVAKHLCSFLSRDNVASGAAVKTAEELQKSKAKITMVRKTLDKAWLLLCQEPDELLLELFAERVEGLCGHRPDEEMMSEYLTEWLRFRDPGKQETGPRRPPPQPVGSGSPRRGGAGRYTYGKPTGFIFLGQRHSASTFRDVLVQLCVQLHQRHSGGFDRVLSLRGRTRDYFSRDYRSLKDPQEIPGTKIFAETNLSANDKIERCYELISLFGHKQGDFKVEMQ